MAKEFIIDRGNAIMEFETFESDELLFIDSINEDGIHNPMWLTLDEVAKLHGHLTHVLGNFSWDFNKDAKADS